MQSAMSAHKSRVASVAVAAVVECASFALGRAPLPALAAVAVKSFAA